MVYVNSVLSGIGALLVASVLYFFIYYAVLIRPRLRQMPPAQSRTGRSYIRPTFLLPYRTPRLRNWFLLGISQSLRMNSTFHTIPHSE